MSNFQPTQLTNQGYTLLSKVLAGVTELKYTKMAIGDGQVESSDYKELTSLVNKKMEVDIRDIKVNGDGSATIKGSYSNIGLTETIQINEVGVYADDPDVGEILYCYTTANGESNFIGQSSTTILYEDLEIQTYISSVESIIANIVMIVNAKNVELELEELKADNVHDGLKELYYSLKPLNNIVTINHRLNRYPIVQVMSNENGFGVGGFGETHFGGSSAITETTRQEHISKNSFNLLVSDEFKLNNPKVNVVEVGKYYTVTFDDTNVSLEIILGE